MIIRIQTASFGWFLDQLPLLMGFFKNIFKKGSKSMVFPVVMCGTIWQTDCLPERSFLRYNVAYGTVLDVAVMSLIAF
ncbi:MAG: hypothetical protein ACK5JF_13590 [Oscillospiraceae bacterium]